MAKRTPKTPPPPPDNLLDDPKFLQYVVANGGMGVDPLSDDGLRLQANYIASVGEHPLDVLKSLVRNPFMEPRDRISAAKALLEYGARKVPSQLELTGKDGTTLSLAAAQLSNLSTTELETLEALLVKANAKSVA